MDGKECVLDIFDTAGQEAFSAVRDQYIRTGEGFMAVFSITRRASFDEAQKIYDHILEVKELDNVPIVLVGNMSDLEKERQVPKAEAQTFASNQLHAPYLETSAKNRTNVYEVFEEVVRQVNKLRPDPGPSSGSSGGDKPSGGGRRRGCTIL